MHPTTPHTPPLRPRQLPPPPRDIEPRRIVPSGKVSPDGKQAWPEPTLTSKVLVLGGAGIAAAALTAAAILATRKVAGMIAGGDEHPVARPRRPQPAASRPQGMMSRPGDDRPPMPRRPSAGPRPNMAQGLVQQADDITRSLTSVLNTVTGAVAGFRGVAAQASTIIREFGDAADTVRGFLEDRSGQARAADRSRMAAADSAVRRYDAPTRRG